jgi:hypothetical protein
MGSERHTAVGPARGAPRASHAARSAAWLALLGMTASAPSLAQTIGVVPGVGEPTPGKSVRLDGSNTVEGVNGAVSLGAAYSDNIGRSDTNKIEETIATAGLRFSVNEQRPRLSTDITSNFEYDDYLHRTFTNELIGSANALVVVGLVPERLTWSVQDYYGQTRANALAAESPANRVNANVLTTGPDLVMPLGGATSLTMQGRWSKATYGRTLPDNQQELGTLGLMEKLTPTSAVSINASAQRVTFDQSQGVTLPTAGSYDVYSSYLQYTATGRRTNLGAQMGYSELRENGTTTSGPLASLSLSRVLSPRATLVFDAGTAFSDSGYLFRRGEQLGGTGLTTSDAVITSDPFRSDHAAAGWSLRAERTTLTLQAQWQRETHELEDVLNRVEISGVAGISHQLSSSVTVGLDGRYGHQNFRVADTVVADWSAAASATWRISRNVTLDGMVGRYSGTVTATTNYTENRALLRLSYGRFR